MKVKKIGVYILILLIVLSLGSCSKSNSATPTQLELLAGTWQVIQTANDTNSNGIMDKTEIKAADSTDISRITFNLDGSATNIDIQSPWGGTDHVTVSAWLFLNNETAIRLSDYSGSPSEYSIVKLTSNELILGQGFTLSNSEYWIVYKKYQ